MAERSPRVLAIDAGGTMTDTFIVDAQGAFVVGKAQTTPEDESVGFMRSSEDALAQWESEPAVEFPKIVSGIYSGTAMLNRLLSRKGRRTGAVLTAGQEDHLNFEPGVQTYRGYSAEPSRGMLQKVRDQTKQNGASFELRAMAAHGGTVSIEANELARTLVSGPIGGVVGGQALAQRMDLPNVLCTDIGGTSFDIALITDGRFEITPTPDIARFVMNSPLVRIDSIGAGTGSFVRVNPNSNRPELGPDSAGSRIGVCWPDGGLETVSVTDLNVVLGRVNPDFFLGGQVQLDPDLAKR